MFGRIISKTASDAISGATVKVSIHGTQELKQYTRQGALKEIHGYLQGPFPYTFNPLIEEKETYTILDIHRGVQILIKRGILKYPNEEELKKRAAVLKKSIAESEQADQHRGLVRERKDNFALTLPRTPEAMRKAVDVKHTKLANDVEEANDILERDHGTGFIVDNELVVTNYHVIVKEEEGHHSIFVSNALIPESLKCTVLAEDAVNDLALLHVPGLCLAEKSITPLRLASSDKLDLLIGQEIFTCGYPLSHTGSSGLFSFGCVSGEKKRWGQPTLSVLNCALNCGNSGGAIFSTFADGEIYVVGVAAQKQFKAILSLKEDSIINELKTSLNTSEIASAGASFNPESKHIQQKTVALLTLRLYEALQTHTQFQLSNAVFGSALKLFLEKVYEEKKMTSDMSSLQNFILPKHESAPALKIDTSGNSVTLGISENSSSIPPVASASHPNFWRSTKSQMASADPVKIVGSNANKLL